MCRWVVTALAAGVLVSMTASVHGATPTADPVITPDATAVYVVASHGMVAWSRRGQDGLFRLVLYRDGQAQDLPIPTAREPFRASFGRGPDGALNLTYGRDLGLWRYDLPAGAERRLTIPGVRRGAEMAAMHGRRVALAGTTDVEVRDLTGKTLFKRRTGEITAFAFDGTHVAWGELVDGVPYMRMHSLRSHRTKTVGRNRIGSVGGAAYQTSAQFFGNHLYWLEPQIGESGGSAGIARVRLDAKHANCSWAARSLKNANLDLPSSVAIDPPAAYYTYGDFTANDQAASVDGIHQTTLADLRFAHPDPWRCP